MRTPDIDAKLDKLLENMSSLKTASDFHTSELNDLKDRLEPVFTHVHGVEMLMKVAGGVVGVIACGAAVLALWH